MNEEGNTRSFELGDGTLRAVAVFLSAMVVGLGAYAGLRDDGDRPASLAPALQLDAAVSDGPLAVSPIASPERRRVEITGVAAGSLPLRSHPSAQPATAVPPAELATDPGASHVDAASLSFAELCAAGLDDEHIGCDHKAEDRGSGRADTTRSRNHEPPGRTISGRILDNSGLGIEGIKVLATAIRSAADRQDTAAAPQRLTAITAPGGHYSFDGLEEGDYRIQTTAHGEYRSAWISVRAGLMKADLVLVPDRTLVVRGQVVGEDSQPLEGVRVLPNMVGVASASTDEDGRYRLKVTLQPAATRINVSFQAPGYLSKTVPVPTFVAGESDGPETNVSMEAVKGWTAVSGSIVSADGEALEGRAVRLQALGHRDAYLASTDEHGEYLFPAVEAGLDYQLRVAGGAGFPDYTRHVRVDIDESAFDVTLQPFDYGEISGRLVNTDGAPVPDFELALRNSASTAPNAIVTSDDHGNFTIERAPAGDILLATRASPSMIVRGVRLEAGDELEVPVVLDWGDHEIRGLVLDQHGYPIAGSDVVLTWTHERNGVRSSSIRRTRSDAQGNFVFGALGPGPHRLEIEAPGRPALAVNYDASRQGYDLTVRMN